MCSELPFLVRVFVEHFECANIWTVRKSWLSDPEGWLSPKHQVFCSSEPQSRELLVKMIIKSDASQTCKLSRHRDSKMIKVVWAYTLAIKFVWGVLVLGWTVSLPRVKMLHALLRSILHGAFVSKVTERVWISSRVLHSSLNFSKNIRIGQNGLALHQWSITWSFPIFPQWYLSSPISRFAHKDFQLT